MKQINIGKMKKKVWIVEYSEEKDAMGQQVQKLRRRKWIWATVKPIKGGEYYEQLKMSPEISYIIYVRYREDITVDSLIYYKGKLLEVKYPIDVEEEHVLLEIQCVEKPKKEGIPWDLDLTLT